MINTTATEAYPNARDCEHGQLRRSCNICEYEKEIKELKHLLDLAWGAIQEAGYEDYDFELRDKIEKAI